MERIGLWNVLHVSEVGQRKFDQFSFGALVFFVKVDGKMTMLARLCKSHFEITCKSIPQL